ncbi:MAG: hypothetical protein JXO72_11135 [Vicinamibacteria bacterium]|nr:hypothetical protein [Vicinamibacteria bacterium]
MTTWDRAAWIGSWLASAAGWSIIGLFGLYVIWNDFRVFINRGHGFAWLIAALVLILLTAHFVVMRHTHRAEHFPQEERARLKRRLAFGHGHGHWRRLMRQSQRHWFKGRSHSGERPRYD